MKKRTRPNEPGRRTCLRCNELFDSASAANRICPSCAKVNAKLRVSEAQLAKERGEHRLNGESLRLRDAYDSSLL